MLEFCSNGREKYLESAKYILLIKKNKCNISITLTHIYRLKTNPNHKNLNSIDKSSDKNVHNRKMLSNCTHGQKLDTQAKNYLHF